MRAGSSEGEAEGGKEGGRDGRAGNQDVVQPLKSIEQEGGQTAAKQQNGEKDFECMFFCFFF